MMIYCCGDLSEIFLDIKDGKKGERRQREREDEERLPELVPRMTLVRRH